MKTPRELLLNKYAAAEPKLDAISDSLFERMRPRDSFSSGWLRQLRQGLRLPRIGWSALGAAWFVIIALNVASRDGASSRVVAQASSPSATDLLREQRALYAEMIGDGMTADAEPSRPKSHKQSAREVESAFA
jgi:hypothetical protein